MASDLSEKEGFASLCLRLRARGISDIDLLKAVEQTPRSLFAPLQHGGEAWSSRTIPIDCGSFMEGADLAVEMLLALGLKSSHRVLEVGTGSGFTAAVMGRLAERVLTIDRFKTLVNQAQIRLDRLELRNIIARQADGSNGLSGEGTFDRILVTAAFPAMPRFYAEQLVSGGVMVAPVNVDDSRCTMVRLTKTGSRFEREDLFDVPFLPIIPQIALAL